MTTALATRPSNGAAPLLSIAPDFEQRTAQALDDVIGRGDITRMTPSDRVNYYRRTCESLGLNPLTKPFEYIQLPGGLKFYATKCCTDQLRKINKVSIPADKIRTSYNKESGMYEVFVTAVLPDGREDSDVGVISIKGLQGDNLANATMKALTKAKRRVTLSICGLGWLDETEVETIANAKTGVVDVETGEAAASDEEKSQNVRAAIIAMMDYAKREDAPLLICYKKTYSRSFGKLPLAELPFCDLEALLDEMVKAQKEATAEVVVVVEEEVAASEVSAVAEVAPEEDPFDDAFIGGDEKIAGQN